MRTRPQMALTAVPATIACALFAVLILAPGVKANGWEHTSIKLETLIATLEDPDPNMRRRAAESLGYRGQAEASEALLERLDDGEQAVRVRAEIFAALGRIGETSALDAIAECLDNESAAGVRAQCAGALGNIDSARAERLALAGLDDKHDSVRLRAIESLGSFSSDKTVEALISLSRQAGSGLQQVALLALGRTRAAAGVEVLVAALDNTRNSKRTIVLLQALTLAANPAALEKIRQIYSETPDEEVKRYALVAIAFTRADGIEPLFLEALTSSDPATRSLGLGVLRRFGRADQAKAIAQRALEDMQDLLASPVERLTGDPTQSIAEVGLMNEYLRTVIRLDPAAGEQIYLRAADSRSIPRGSAAELKMAEGFYQARWHSIYGLGYCRSDAARRTVTGALADPDARIRAVAVRSIGVMGDRPHDSRI